MSQDFNQMLDDAVADARRMHRLGRAPSELEASVLARMRGAQAAATSAQASSSSAQSAANAELTRSTQSVSLVSRIQGAWRRFTQTRFMPAMIGSLATVTLIAISAPWWLQFVRESHEVATPFMLVSEPHTAQLDVSQMLRVNVSREVMLDFGIPVPPQRLQESVKAEMLMGARGELLAVRFIEPKLEKRWRWQFY
jgi:hypothetical protein